MASPRHSLALRILASAGAGLLALPLVAAVVMGVVLLVAGPHSGLLPEWMEAMMLMLGWVTVVSVPAWIGWRTWVRLSRIE